MTRPKLTTSDRQTLNLVRKQLTTTWDRYGMRYLLIGLAELIENDADTVESLKLPEPHFAEEVKEKRTMVDYLYLAAASPCMQDETTGPLPTEQT